ncbi:MAG TPA: aldehyde dehydrogenase family protein, partial [Acidimicrobiales bacterium]|nr:aldehyde dehydrogenase family protein [Acidimicrobiales bacterium]
MTTVSPAEQLGQPPHPLVSRSPQAPTRVLASFSEMGPDEVAAAAALARKAARDWAATAAPGRAAALGRAAAALDEASGELVELGIAEVGKPRAEMAGEVQRGVAILRYYAGAALDPEGDVLPSPDGRSLLLSRRLAQGVAGLITPWNFPVAIPLWKLAPAIAYGNAALWKPAPSATAVARRLDAVLQECLPAGLVQLLPGDATTGEALVGAADVISFTGSSAVGASVVARGAERQIPVQAEMGGQNPSIVLPDADLPQAAGLVAASAMGYAGQKCTATSRVIVVGDGRDFLDAFIEAVRALRVGDPDDAATAVGPVISATARDNALGAVSSARGAGARLITGGHSLPREGYFMEPTLVGDLEPGSFLCQEEVFAPVAAVLAARDLDEAIEIANGVRFGLVASVYTSDLDQAMRAVRCLRAGLVRVNAPTSGVDFYAPFGGAGASGYGLKEQGKA